MSKSKSPSLPNTPTLYQNPVVNQAITQLQGLGSTLTSKGLLTDPVLGATVNTNPEVTRLTLEGLQAQLAPELRRSRQDTINQLEANNQLTGSTTASALGNIQSDYESRLVTAGAEAGIADINRAMQNRVALYGVGLNTIQSAGQMGLSEQSQVNQFNLENYQNQVAKVMAEQKQNKGGLIGGLTGAIGGGLAGFAMGGPVGAGIGAVGGGLAGGFGTPGTGGGFLQAGAGLAGQSFYKPQSYNATQSTPFTTNYGNESIFNTLGSKGLMTAGGWI